MTIGKQVADAADVTAIAVVVGSLAEWLPPAAAAAALVWTLIRIYEWARVALWKQPPR